MRHHLPYRLRALATRAIEIRPRQRSNVSACVTERSQRLHSSSYRAGFFSSLPECAVSIQVRPGNACCAFVTTHYDRGLFDVQLFQRKDSILNQARDGGGVGLSSFRSLCVVEFLL